MGSRKRNPGKASPSGKRARDPFYQLSTVRPRIMATAAAIQRVNEALRNDTTGEGAPIRAKVISEANKLLTENPVKWSKDGVYDQGKEALKRLQYLGLAWLLERTNPKYVERAKLELAAICSFRDWNPAHFLSTALLTHAAAIGYDWFYDQLAATEREACVNAILEKGLEPGLAQLKDPKSRWPNRTYNWNLVCNAGLVVGALSVGDEPTGLAKEVLERCLQSVPTGLRGYSPHGSWDEGPAYWTFATESTAYLISALETAVGHDFGFRHLPGLCHTGRFRLHAEGASKNTDGGVRMFNYSDCEEFRAGSWCMRWLSLKFGRPEYILVPRQGRLRPMDLLWFSPHPPDEDAQALPRNALFLGGANVAMLRGNSSNKSLVFRPWLRSKSEGNTVYLGIRAGANSPDNDHGQLDLGSFVLDVAGFRWALDIEPKSAAGYTDDYKLPGYFDMSRRFRYYRTSTIGHNTLVINRQNQLLGVETEIVGFAATEELSLAVVDLTAAYPDCQRVRRGFALIERQHVLIMDEITPKHRIEVDWQMHTAAKATKGTTARLTQGSTSQFFARILEPSGVAFEVRSASVTQPGETPNTGINKLVATLRDFIDPARIAVQLSAQREPIQLPEPLEGPLWTWIKWAAENFDPNARLS